MSSFYAKLGTSMSEILLSNRVLFCWCCGKPTHCWLSKMV